VQNFTFFWCVFANEKWNWSVFWRRIAHIYFLFFLLIYFTIQNFQHIKNSAAQSFKKIKYAHFRWVDERTPHLSNNLYENGKPITLDKVYIFLIFKNISSNINLWIHLILIGIHLYVYTFDSKPQYKIDSPTWQHHHFLLLLQKLFNLLNWAG
jgi:hypothetical protein